MLRRLTGHRTQTEDTSGVTLGRAALKATGRGDGTDAEIRRKPAVAALLDAGDADRADALQWLVREAVEPPSDYGARRLVAMVAARRMPVPAESLVAMLTTIRAGLESKHGWLATSVLEAVSRSIGRWMEPYAPGDAETVRGLVKSILQVSQTNTTIRLKPAAVEQLRALLPRAEVDIDAIPLGDAFGRAARTIISESDERPELLGPFVTSLTTPLKGVRPADRWLDSVRSTAGPLADPARLVRALLTAALESEDGVVRYDYTGAFQGGTEIEMARYLAPQNEAMLKTCVWAAAALEDAAAIPILRNLTLKCATVIGGQFGSPRSLTVAMTCPAAIARIGASGSLTALQGLQRSVKHGSVLREVGKAIDALATAQSVSRSELLETSIERHDLDAAGERRVPVGDASAVLAIHGSGDVTVAWHTADGRIAASAPAALRERYPDDVRSVGALAKALRDTVAAERHRLDGLFVEARRWPLATWQQRYLDHPVTGALSRSLIWRFSVDGSVVDGLPETGDRATDRAGESLAIDERSEVELWHPATVSARDVQAWRERLMAERRSQPIKQAFREIYLVTPAELETLTYSNRFASHIIRQVQARALMKGRGWKPVPLAWWDDGIDHGVTRRTYDAYEIRAEFFYDPILDVQPTSGDMYPYCTTDQVAFFRGATDQRIELADVPTILFSEVMRDVDLFVGVTSIGADPNWLDRGERRFETYWHQWGFGELTQAGQIRHQVIESLLPALAISDRCSLEDRYLEVRGNLRSYRIHLGSGNILMRPNDQYLCIVAARPPGGEKRIFLPFDDDPTLTLILSKAFMLANDDAIKDASIVRQIKQQ